jgi:RNA polymerase sigma factor (sigma-70 family)
MVSEHLFRRESGRMLAAVTRIFGTHNLALAEDVVQDALCRALEVWAYRGVPENPGAWLMMTAKNRAIDVLRRERSARQFAPELGQRMETEWTLRPTVTELFTQHEIDDDVLRMMFTCCSPRISEDAQIALVLNVISGFGASEIAHAFLASEAAIEKRLSRAKAALAESKSLYDVAGGAELGSRLNAVHRALYLLFSEGYHGAHPERALQTELCVEAIRLVELLAAHEVTAVPQTHALAGLMNLHAARIPGRISASGELSPLVEQDRLLWDKTLIDRGIAWLDKSAEGAELTEYHIEAAIAAAHSTARRAEDTPWTHIVELYDVLLRMRPSPVVALNRAIAIAERDGPQEGLAAIESIADKARLDEYPFFFAAKGELERRLGHQEAARAEFERALALARNPEERRFFRSRATEAR